MPAIRLRRARLAAVLAVVAGLAVGACSPGQTIESVEVLLDIQAGAKPSPLKRATPTPSREAVTFQVDGRTREADLYRPGAGEPIEGGIVLVPGLTPKGRNDHRVVEFATTLARARFAVLVPDLLPMRSQIATASDAAPIADGICHLSGVLPDRSIGLAGVSFALGPGILALFEPQARSRVDFVLGIGGYYDMPALITFFTTEYVRDGEGLPWRRQEASEFGKYVFLITAAANIDSLDDRVLLLDIAARRLDDQAAPIDDLTRQLGPDGQAVIAILANTDPDMTPSLLAALPEHAREQILALDLRRRDIADIDARFILVHDRNDPVVPAAQSVALAAAARPEMADAYLVQGLTHADARGIDVGDAGALVRAIYAVLDYREPRPAGETAPPCPTAAKAAEDARQAGQSPPDAP